MNEFCSNYDKLLYRKFTDIYNNVSSEHSPIAVVSYVCIENTNFQLPYKLFSAVCTFRVFLLFIDDIQS